MIVKRAQSKTDFEEANQILHSAYQELYLKSKFRNLETDYETFFKRICFNFPVDESLVCLLLKDEKNTALATATIYLERPGKKLPAEEWLKMDLSVQRAAGKKLGEVGRLAILPHLKASGACSGQALDLLFKGLAEVCMENDIVLLISEAVSHLFPMYKKLGFEGVLGLEKPVNDAEMLLQCVPCQLDLPARISTVVQQRLLANPTYKSPFLEKFNAYMGRVA